MAAHDIGQRRRRPLSFTDALLDFLAQRRVTQHLLIDLEQRMFLGGDTTGETLRRDADLFAHGVDRLLEACDLEFDIGGDQIRDGVQVGRRRQHEGLADGDTGRAGHAGEGRLTAGTSQLAQRPGGQRVGQHSRQLRAEGDKEGFLTFIETALLVLLDDQHPEHATLMDDGDTEEAGETLLSGLLEITELGMCGRILEVERLFSERHHPDQALATCQTDLPHRRRAQTDGVLEHEAIAFRCQQIDGADVRLHGLAYAQHHGRQCRVQRTCAIDLLNDTT